MSAPALDRSAIVPQDDDLWNDDAEDVCAHGRGWDQVCVMCCPEDDDGSETGEDWS